MSVLSKSVVALIALAASITPSLGAPLEARQRNFFPITGPSVGGVQPRLEIRDVQANAEYFNLFILAIKRFQDMNQDDKLSYFQISGMYCVPQLSSITAERSRYPWPTSY
jgi:tyrosinase